MVGPMYQTRRPESVGNLGDKERSQGGLSIPEKVTKAFIKLSADYKSD